MCEQNTEFHFAKYRMAVHSGKEKKRYAATTTTRETVFGADVSSPKLNTQINCMKDINVHHFITSSIQISIDHFVLI